MARGTIKSDSASGVDNLRVGKSAADQVNIGIRRHTWYRMDMRNNLRASDFLK